MRVAPFRNYRIINYLHLPDTYRSLSRLSSPLRAKASSIRPSLLSLLHYDSLNYLSYRSSFEEAVKLILVCQYVNERFSLIWLSGL
jgi:hypothetical protein